MAARPEFSAETHDDVGSLAVSIFDRDALSQAFDGIDVILHLATHIPTGASAVDSSAWQENDMLRADATAALVDAAMEAGVTTFVYPSVCFVYADGGSAWLRAGAPLDPAAVLDSTLAAEREVARFAAHADTRGVVLRLGSLYGPSSATTRASLVTAARGGPALPGPGDAYTPTLWENDAGSALAAALHAPSGVYDIVDDDPLPRAAVNDLYLRAVGRRPTGTLAPSGDELAGTALGFLLRSHRITNSSFRQATEWRPSIASVADATDALGLIATEAPHALTPTATHHRRPQPPETDMLTETDFELLARHTDAENGHRLDDTLATLTPDCTFEDVALGLTLTGHAGAAEYYRMWWDGLDVTVDVEDVLTVADQPIVVAETTWRGHHIGPFLGVDATNRPVRVPVVIIARLEAGLLAHERLYWDRQHVLDQIR